MVEVVEHPHRPRGVPLQAQAAGPDRPGAVVIELVPNENGWRGTTRLAEDAPLGLDVTLEVSLPGYGRSPSGPDAAARQTVRDLARDLLRAPVAIAQDAAGTVDEDF